MSFFNGASSLVFYESPRTTVSARNLLERFTEEKAWGWEMNRQMYILVYSPFKAFWFVKIIRVSSDMQLSWSWKKGKKFIQRSLDFGRNFNVKVTLPSSVMAMNSQLSAVYNAVLHTSVLCNKLRKSVQFSWFPIHPFYTHMGFLHVWRFNLSIRKL